jgi:hypothetical protein
MSNETEAIKFLKEYNVKYVVVYTSFREDGSDAVYGDEGKWRWMARIGGLDDAKYGNLTLGLDWADVNGDYNQDENELIPNELGENTVLYKLMHYARSMVSLGYSEIELEHFEGPPQGYFSQQSGSVLAYQDSSTTSFAITVCVYKVNYD